MNAISFRRYGLMKVMHLRECETMNADWYARCRDFGGSSFWRSTSAVRTLGGSAASRPSKRPHRSTKFSPLGRKRRAVGRSSIFFPRLGPNEFFRSSKAKTELVLSLFRCDKRTLTALEAVLKKLSLHLIGVVRFRSGL